MRAERGLAFHQWASSFFFPSPAPQLGSLLVTHGAGARRHNPQLRRDSAMLGTPPAALMVPLLFSERETEKSGCVFPDSFCCKRADIPSGGHLFPCNMTCVCASKKECTGCACGNSQLSSCLRLQLASYVTPQKGVEVRVSSSAIQDKNRAALACGGACGTLPPIFPWACAFDFFSSTGHLAPVLHEV